MKYFAFIAAFILTIATGNAASCIGGNTQEDFLKVPAARGQVVYTIIKAKQADFKAELAKILKPDVPYTDSSAVYLAKLSDAGYGVVLFDAGCVVMGTAQVLPTFIMKYLFQQAHVNMVDMYINKTSLEL